MGFFKDVRDDIKAVLERDPAARNGFEVLVCYPGIWSVIFHRPAHWLYKHNLKLLARIISQIVGLQELKFTPERLSANAASSTTAWLLS